MPRNRASTINLQTLPRDLEEYIRRFSQPKILEPFLRGEAYHFGDMSDDALAILEHMQDDIQEIKQEQKVIVGQIKELHSQVSQDDLMSLKSIIIKELQESEEPIFPGTIALKYEIDFSKIQRAIKELRKEGILE